MTRAPFVAAVPAIALALALGGIAFADQTYNVSGRDIFSIGAGDIRSEISYAGTQTLTIRRRGRAIRYGAHVSYRRSDGAAATDASADYLADVAPSGAAIDSADRDPDYLTVLNQPFSAQLDPGTLGDLRGLAGAVPFDFPSPITGGALHGYLRRLGDGTIAGRRVLGIRFEAAGTMRGALPDRPGLTLRGTITMRGSAFYSLVDAVVLGLDTTVTITGFVSNRTGKDPVTIVYERSIRAVQPGGGATAAK
jgi:hypothetical protein